VIQSRLLSYGLVFVQFGTLFILAFTGLAVPHKPLVWIMGISGIVLGMWALATMRLDKVSILPEVQEGSALVTTGPYLWIRHPMYTSLLLVGGSLALNNPLWWRWMVWGLLCINQILKLLYEERLLKVQFPEYQVYIERTKRLIPFVF
jgi:protein-S-isoprenylcysteine O-methyltransferase Ste14